MFISEEGQELAYKAFEDAMENKEEEDPLKRVSTAMKNMIEIYVTNSPLFARFNFISNLMPLTPEERENIDWDKVREILTTNVGETDFNAFDEEITSYKTFMEAQIRFINSYLLGCGKWRVKKCKDCGEEFFLTKDEVDYFVRKELKLPKRCSDCRDARKNGTAKKEKEVSTSTQQSAPIAPVPKQPTIMEMKMKEAMAKLKS